MWKINISLNEYLKVINYQVIITFIEEVITILYEQFI